MVTLTGSSCYDIAADLGHVGTPSAGVFPSLAPVCVVLADLACVKRPAQPRHALAILLVGFRTGALAYELSTLLVFGAVSMDHELGLDGAGPAAGFAGNKARRVVVY